MYRLSPCCVDLRAVSAVVCVAEVETSVLMGLLGSICGLEVDGVMCVPRLVSQLVGVCLLPLVLEKKTVIR